MRTGGSTFANPHGHKAWQVIDAAGCRGKRVGDASMNEKHCNFLINHGAATAADIEQLGCAVSDAVRAHSGVELRWEIKRLGRHLSQIGRCLMMAQDPKRVVVLMGGWTSEAAVSRVSAAFCAKAARAAGWDAIEVEFDRDIQTRLKELNPARVYNALHGQIGEDGSVQGLLNIMGIPYTHSGVVASSVAMNKVLSRQLFRTAGIAVPLRLSLNEDNGTLQPVNYEGDYVVKPVNEGSSFGVQIIQEVITRRPMTSGP